MAAANWFCICCCRSTERVGSGKRPCLRRVFLYGNVFTEISSPYTTSYAITGTITLASALGDNLTLADPVTPLSFSFSDGVQTITQSSGIITPTFKFATDAAGNITQWWIEVEQTTFCIVSDNPSANSGTLGDQGYFPPTGYGINSNNPGVWSGPLWSTPLPAALPLFATGLGALGLLGWRRKRKAIAFQ